VGADEVDDVPGDLLGDLVGDDDEAPLDGAEELDPLVIGVESVMVPFGPLDVQALSAGAAATTAARTTARGRITRDYVAFTSPSRRFG
jgi:hypothetical protein